MPIGWAAAGTITFGGPDTDPNGFAMYRNNQKLEDGSSPAKVLEIHPQMVNDGVMTGTLPCLYGSHRRTL